MQIDNVKFIFDGKVSNNTYNITYENDEITNISASKSSNVFNYITMPYADIHTHGAMGHDVSELTKDALSSISDYLKQNGIGYFVPTFVATPITKLNESFITLRKLKDEVSGAKILGAHIEGPFISIAKKGAQPLENIVTKYDEKDASFFTANKDILKIVTLCPHTENSEILTKAITSNGIKVQAGHDDSVDNEIIECMNNGLDGVTHLYCASSGFRRINGKIEKHLGLNECALLYDDLYTEIIADNIHISPLLFKLIYKVKGFRKIMLVSDSLAPAGAPDGEYILGDNTEIITDGKVAYLKDKSALAGSITNISKMVENVVALGVPVEEAVYMVSECPLKYLGITPEKVQLGSKHFNVIDKKGKLIKAY